jgi:hypothetical protein
VSAKNAGVVSENKELRIFEPNTDEVIGKWRKLYDELRI